MPSVIYIFPYILSLHDYWRRISKQKKLAINQVLLGNGSDEVLDLIFRAFCEPNQDSVLTLPPSYGMYSVLAQLNSIENIEVSLINDFR